MTKRTSVRAKAREIYRELAAKETKANSETTNAATPTPDPSPQGRGEQSDLTTRIRALYEHSAVPVREIATTAGVTERTIYKYVAKQGWTRRYRVLPRELAAASANRRPRSEALPEFAPVKGAGSRFIRRNEKGEPFAQGLKATDPGGAALASAECLEAESLSRKAQVEAAREQRLEAQLQAILAISRANTELQSFWAEQDVKRRQHPKGQVWKPSYAEGMLERVLVLAVEIPLRQCEALLAEDNAAWAAEEGATGP